LDAAVRNAEPWLKNTGLTVRIHCTCVILIVIVTDAVRNNPLTSKAIDVDVEHRVKMWLRVTVSVRGAVDRAGGRTQQKKAQAAERYQPITFIFSLDAFGWRRGVVVSGVGLINEVNRH